MREDAFWARPSLWLIDANLITGLLARVVGVIDYFTISHRPFADALPLRRCGRDFRHFPGKGNLAAH